MTTEKDKGTNKRLTLEITEVLEPKDIGKDKPFMMLEFKAKGEDGDKELSYKAFSSKLFEPIQTSTSIDCDINITTKTVEGQDGPFTYTNRKVTQIYVDGQPVNVRQSSGYGGKDYKSDPDTRASIEAQKASDLVMTAYTQLRIAGLPMMPIGLEAAWERALDWCNDHIPSRGEAPKAPQTTPQPRQAEVKEQSDVTGTAKLIEAVCAAKKFKTPKTARTWLTNVCRIESDRIDTEPDKVLAEVEPYF